MGHSIWNTGLAQTYSGVFSELYQPAQGVSPKGKIMGRTNAPEGFTQDDRNPELYWGPTIEDGYFLALFWNAEEGIQLHTEISGTSTLEETLKLGTDIALMAGRMKDLG